MKRWILLCVSHLFVAFIGFSAGIYLLPIITAPEAPSSSDINQMTEGAIFTGEFRRDLAGSDLFHWGEGTLYITDGVIALNGEIAPGPDYKLYLSPTFVEDEQTFQQHRASMIQVGDINTFQNFIVQIPDQIDPSQYRTVIVWCESFNEFITAATYQ